MKLRPPQVLKKAAINGAWDNNFQNIANIDACGSGKSVLNAAILQENDGPSCVIAHRQELVCQLSTALAKNGVYHRIIGPKKVIQLIVHNHMEEVGANFYNGSAPTAVAGVDTLIRRKSELWSWAKTVNLWSLDECHHLQRENKWGTAVQMFPATARGLGLTATLCRGDGRGLGRETDGLFDIMLPGPSPRDHINAGYLTDYRFYKPQTKDYNRASIPVGASGEFTKEGNKNAVRNSAIIGDVVGHYLRYCKGKLGVTFMPDCDSAHDTAVEFNRRGVPAAVVTAKTPLDERVAILAKFARRQILQLVNVDLFGEGFDLPAIEVVQMARATKSYSLCHQQFMRALRLMISKWLSDRWGSFTDTQRLGYIAESEKPFAIIFDHVGNIDPAHGGFGLPDKPKVYTLDRQDTRQASVDPDVIPLRRCMNPECNLQYERIHKICPYCNTVHIPTSRSGPEFVDGDLTELDAVTLARMRGEIDNVDMSLSEYRMLMEAKHAPYIGAHLKRHKEQQLAQGGLRASIEWWAGFQRAKAVSDDESYRRFYFNFGIDVLTAQSLKIKDAIALSKRINEVLANESKRMGYEVEHSI